MASTELNHLSITGFAHSDWIAEAPPDAQREMAMALERGDVLYFSNLGFEPSAAELRLFSPTIVGSSKNVGFDPANGRLSGTTLEAADRRALGEMLARFSRQAAALVHGLLPVYRGQVVQGRASFRPVEIAGRSTSWRKDDTRLHIDAFPATPVRGRRILRVFTNVNPQRLPRTWRVGEPFDAVARRFTSRLRLPLPGVAMMLAWVGATKTRRTAYDALMLQLHDQMKADENYQARCAQTTIDFPAGSTWIAFTDQVSHAAMAGQYQLEQTFTVPVEAMLDDQTSPLRILERLKGRRLA
jgi:hypothetical protein